MATLIGTVVDDVDIVVECGKIKEFARATRADDAVHRDLAVATERGYGDLLATATHVVVTGHVRDQAGFVDALGLDIRRVVVGSVGWRYERPVTAGDQLNAVRRVVSDEKLESRSGGTVRRITMATEFRDHVGHLVVTQTEQLIERPAR